MIEMRSGLKHLLIYRLTRLNQKCCMVAKSFMFSPVRIISVPISIAITRGDYIIEWFITGTRYLTLGTPVLRVMFMRVPGLNWWFWCGREGSGWTCHQGVDHPIVYELLLANEYRLIIDYCKKLAKID